MHHELYQSLQPPSPTWFHNKLFRTKSEAKWAYVFLALGIPYYYEPSTYMLAKGAYLPDFWLPTIGCYVEVKPANVDDARFDELGETRGVRVFLVDATMPQIPRDRREPVIHAALRGHIWQKWPDNEPDYMLALEASGRANFVPIRRGSLADGTDYTILQAYIEASSYRFRDY